MPDPDVTVLIASRDRCDHLSKSLDLVLPAVAASRYPAEVVVIDNGSSDGTAEMLRCRGADVPALRVITDPRPGKSGAVNRALSETKGRAIIFTDDDVHVAASWVDDMASPILDGVADAVCGRVVLASHLDRPWLTPNLREKLAEMLDVSGTEPGMVGANMAVSREAAMAIRFDENLGPGARGFADDVLFNLRLKFAGYRLVGSEGPPVEHHLSADRLTYGVMVSLAEKNGSSHAYLWHHWLAADLRLVPLRLAVAKARRTRVRLRRPKGAPAEMTDAEYEQIYAQSFLRALVAERRVPRAYTT